MREGYRMKNRNTVLVSGIAVFFHLQHWDRIFNGFGHLQFAAFNLIK